MELVTVNELIPAISPLLPQLMGLTEEDLQKLERAKQQVATVLTFFEELLGEQHTFVGNILP